MVPATHRIVAERLLYVFCSPDGLPATKCEAQPCTMSTKNLLRGLPVKNDSLLTLLYNAAAMIVFGCKRAVRHCEGFKVGSFPNVEYLVCYESWSVEALDEARAYRDDAKAAARFVLLRYMPAGAGMSELSIIVVHGDD